MSEAESEADEHKTHSPGVRGLVERVTGHHEDAVRRREEQELARDAEQAGFDLSTDIAHPEPGAGHSAAGFDIETDIGQDKEPPELRDS